MTPEELKDIEDRINKTSWELTVNGLFNKADCDFVMYGKRGLQKLLDYIKELESQIPRGGNSGAPHLFNNKNRRRKVMEITLTDLKELFGNTSSSSSSSSPWEIGSIYLVRTVTMIDTGRLVAVTDQELVLEDAAWIADTGRFSDSLKKAEFSEVEPFPDGKVIVGRGAVIDAVKISKAPRDQK